MRYIPLTPDDRKEMLETIGAPSVESLFDSIPAEIRLNGGLDLPSPMTEQELMRHMREMAAMNRPLSSLPSFLGAGAYNHFIPSAIDQLITRSEFYTAYTPYQPEISQGTLQAIYEFQSYVCAIFGMEVANASMYDGASALAEAVLMACRVSRKNGIVMSDLVHPRWRQVVRGYTRNRGTEITELPDHAGGKVDAARLAGAITDETAAVVVQSPNFFGCIEDLEAISSICREKKVLLVVGVAEPVSLGILKSPGDFGADIVVGEGQPLGLPLSFGGPYVGLFATREKYMRQMPGRLCGKTEDKDGKPGFVLTLAAREQHIRREKATSNICSNQALCALAVTMYLTLMGKTGIRKTARNNLLAAGALREGIEKLENARISFPHPFFNEFLVELGSPAKAVNERLLESGVLGGLDVSSYYPAMKNSMLLCATELTTRGDIEKLLKGLEG